MSRAGQTRSETTSARYAQHFTELKGELSGLGYFFKGTVLKRMMKCGQDRCACQHDPSKRHGPYFEWTYKANGKTVNVKLSGKPHRSTKPPQSSTVSSRPFWRGWNVCPGPH